jgi:hypothetical protein
MTASDSLHSLLDHERLLFCVTDLVPIYKSVTSSASVVRWLALHSWTLDFWVLLWLNGWTHERTHLNWTLESMMCHRFITSRRPECRSPSQTVPLLFYVYPCYETCVNAVATLWFLEAYSLPRIRTLASLCLAMDYSAVQASCHNIQWPGKEAATSTMYLYRSCCTEPQ